MLSERFKSEPAAAYQIDTSQYGEFNQDFIFNNELALKKVRWRNFIRDCKSILSDASEVSALLEQEWSEAQQWLHETYQDVIDNFDPKILPLKRKRKVMMAPSVLDALQQMDEDME